MSVIKPVTPDLARQLSEAIGDLATDYKGAWDESAVSAIIIQRAHSRNLPGQLTLADLEAAEIVTEGRLNFEQLNSIKVGVQKGK